MEQDPVSGRLSHLALTPSPTRTADYELGAVDVKRKKAATIMIRQALRLYPLSSRPAWRLGFRLQLSKDQCVVNPLKGLRSSSSLWSMTLRKWGMEIVWYFLYSLYIW